jgi:hypothetical protein
LRGTYFYLADAAGVAGFAQAVPLLRVGQRGAAAAALLAIAYGLLRIVVGDAVSGKGWERPRVGIVAVGLRRRGLQVAEEVVFVVVRAGWVGVRE